MTYTISSTIDVNARVDVGNIRFNTNTISSINTNGNIILSLNGAGMVGINNSSPSAKLDITPSSGDHALRIDGDCGSSDAQVVFSGSTYGIALSINNNSSSRYALAVSNSSGSVMYVRADGLVGVGTSSPDETLHVSGNVSIDAFSQGDGAGIFFRDGYNSGNDPYNLSITAKDWRGGTTTSDGFVISGYHGIGFQTNSNSYASGNIRMFVANNGIVGVGTISPSVGKIQVSGYVGGSVPRGYYTTHTSGSNIATQATSGSGFAYSIYCSNAIGANGIGWTSDERIKTEIAVVDDTWALQKVRDIECKEYHYIDPMLRKEHKTIGYIAQDIEQHLPQAVSVITDYVPDEMTPIENITWTPVDGGFKVIIPSLTFSSEHTRQLLFYVTLGEEEPEQRIELTADEDNAVIFEQQYSTVFLYGKKVNNFLQIAKDKIYSLHHSAIQEIDRRQSVDNERILELEGDLSSAQETIATLQAQVAALLQHTGITV